MAKQTFYWHDYETSGADTRRDRPLQFAGIRTDMDLNIIEEPMMIYCSPAEDVLPHPEACLITGITPQQALREGYCEAEFMQQVHEQLARPGTCGVGYNSIRFDDEITRQALYRNFFDPYAREWQNGCSRWDIIDMMRLTRALRPEGIEWPEYPDGRPSMRLEDLTKANGIDHGNAHDALSDVHATIGMARLVKERQPKLYNYVLNNRSKQAVQNMLDVVTMKPVLHVSSMYPAEWGNLAIVAPVAAHPVNRNSIIVYDLRVDPSAMLAMPKEDIKRLLYTATDDLAPGETRLPLKQLHTNKSPIVAPAGMLSTEEANRLAIRGPDCRTHLEMLRASRDLKEKLAWVFAEQDFAEDLDPDHMLYGGGFFNDSDKAAMNQIREASPAQLGEMEFAFQDPRLEEMLLRYKARNYPHTLDEEQRQRWEEYRKQKLMGPSNGGYLTIPALFDCLNKLYQQPETEQKQREILEELALYAESIYPADEVY